jgi:hypothetical protein
VTDAGHFEHYSPSLVSFRAFAALFLHFLALAARVQEQQPANASAVFGSASGAAASLLVRTSANIAMMHLRKGREAQESLIRAKRLRKQACASAWTKFNTFLCLSS